MLITNLLTTIALVWSAPQIPPNYRKRIQGENKQLYWSVNVRDYNTGVNIAISAKGLYQVAPIQEQLGITAMRKQCPQVFENTGFARVCKNFCASRLIPIKRNLVLVEYEVDWELRGSKNIENPKGTKTSGLGNADVRRVINQKEEITIGELVILRIKKIRDL
ncbi:MAG: hypothetical protein FWG02_08480 [Holophagaceae bacterium]|nr:hypothetical protein [Holophagaceae bacterium]